MSVSSTSGVIAGGTPPSLQLIQTQIVPGPFDLPSLVFAGLTGDTHGAYLIRGHWTNGSVVGQPPTFLRLHLLPNGILGPAPPDTSVVQRLRGQGPIASSEDRATAASLEVAELAAHAPNMVVTFETLLLARSPAAGGVTPRQFLTRAHSVDNDNGSIFRTSQIGTTWGTDDTNEITSLVLQTRNNGGTPVSGLAPGSRISLYRVEG